MRGETVVGDLPPCKLLNYLPYRSTALSSSLHSNYVEFVIEGLSCLSPLCSDYVEFVMAMLGTNDNEVLKYLVYIEALWSGCPESQDPARLQHGRIDHRVLMLPQDRIDSAKVISLVPIHS